MKYIVTWRHTCAEQSYLTIFEGSAGMPFLQIMDRVHEIEEVSYTDATQGGIDYEVYSIVRADNVEVIW